MDSMRGVTVLQEVQVEVLNKVSNKLLEEDEDCSRVWKSAGRRIDGWMRFEIRRVEDVEKDLEVPVACEGLAEVYIFDS